MREKATGGDVQVVSGGRRGPRIAFVSSYVPTRCGLASFTRNLLRAMASVRGSLEGLAVVRLVDRPFEDPCPEVVLQHVRGRPAAATMGSLEAVFEAVILQHEYGIYGGADGEEAVDLVRASSLPVVAVLHTVLSRPTPHQQAVLEEVADAARAVVVMGRSSLERLRSGYRVDPDRTHVVPHGAGTFDCGGPLDGRTILTWGLLSPGKGIEWGIGALALLSDLDVEYVVAGQTHPKVRRAGGESYRRELLDRARRLGVADRVTFQDAYLDPQVLCGLIRQASVVLLPYESTEQISSGVLVEALAAGRPVVATPFPQALELLTSGAGLLVPRRDPEAVASALRRVLTEPGLAERMARAARRVARPFSWRSVATAYERLVAEVVEAERAPIEVA